MLAEPDRYRAPPEENVPSIEGFNTNVGFKTINISFLSSNETWSSHVPWLLQTTERIQCGIFFWYIYELFVFFHLWNTFVCQWPIFHFLVQIHNNHDSHLSLGHDPNVLLIWLFPVLFIRNYEQTDGEGGKGRWRNSKDKWCQLHITNQLQIITNWTYVYSIVRIIKYTILYIINYIMYIEQKPNIDPHL